MRLVRGKPWRAVVGVVLLLGLAGCQGTPDLSADRADQFQERVLAITASVAEGGYAGALEQVAALEAELDAAAADGSVSFSRHQRIEAALTAVRADVQAAIDAQTPPEPVEPVQPAEPVTPPAENQNEDEGGDKGNGNDGDKGNKGNKDDDGDDD